MSPELATSPFFIAAVTLAIFGAILILAGIATNGVVFLLPQIPDPAV